MIDYETFSKIKLYAERDGLNIQQIASRLELDLCWFSGNRTFDPLEIRRTRPLISGFFGVSWRKSLTYRSSLTPRNIRWALPHTPGFSEAYPHGLSIP